MDTLDVSLEHEALNYLRLSLTQESLQANVELVEPLDIRELGELSDQSRKMCDGFDQLTDAALASEGIANFITDRYEKGELSEDVLKVSNVALETYLSRLNVRVNRPITMESFKTKNLAQEDLFNIASWSLGEAAVAAGAVGAAVMFGPSIVSGAYKGAKAVAGFVKDVAVGTYRFIKKKMVLLARHIVKVLGSFARSRRHLEGRIRDIEALVGTAKRKVPLVKYIKAEGWCEYLCYTKRPFSTGLEGIYHEVDTLVTEHSKMSKLAMAKYMDFMQSMDNVRDDPLERLRITPNEFLLPGMKEFNRSLRFETPNRDNVFFQTHELPGGRAFYTQTNPVDTVGVEAVRTLEVVDFQVYYHDPRSYEVFKMKLAAAIALPMTAFLTLVNPLLGAGALIASSAYIGTRGVDGTGSKVNIDPSTIFDCLSLDDCKRVLQEVREGSMGLKNWSATVLTDPWKSQDIDELVLSICDREESTSNMKAYCNAVLTMMNRLSCDVPAYAFKVYNAMLNFTEKSLKQYR